MSNVYQQRDDVAQGIVDDAVKNLKNGAGQPLPRGTDHTKPALVPPLLPPSPIKKTNVWPQKIRIPLPD